MDVLDAIRSFQPCTQFDSRPIPPEQLRNVLAAARLSPSQQNLQPWRFVVVQDDERRRRLAQAISRGGKLVLEAPVAIVAFAVEEDIPVTVGGYISAYPLDVAVAVHSLEPAATAEGLGTHWLVDFNEEKVRQVLGVAEGIHPIAILPIGYPLHPNNGSSPPPEGRKSPDEIIAYDAYPW